MQLPKLPKTRGPLVATAAVAVALAGGATALAVSPSGDGDHSATLAGQINPAKPKNVILLIGDGTDDSMITAARNYEKGAGGSFEGLDNLPFVGGMTTYGLKTGKKANGQYPINYVSDSAPTASGWSTGKKTVDSRLSQGPSESDTIPGEDYETVLEKFKKDGKRVGNVSTAALTDATPAAAGSHINLRACQGPENMANCTAAQKKNGGKGSVAEQLVDNKIDVLLGGGRNRFAQSTDDGPSVLEYAKEKYGYRELRTKAELDGVTTLAGGPVLGVFSGGTDALPKSTTGENLKPLYESLVATPAGAGGDTQKCTPADRGTQPRLADMTQRAIDLLEQNNDRGFFLQVESAMVDKQEHAADICGAIGDLAELDRATQVALEFQKANPDTLIIVTGDHAHSTQIVPNPNYEGQAAGKRIATLQTVDGDPMTVAYSTSDPADAGGSQTHTGSQIRVAAKGPQAANVAGKIDQTDLFDVMLGLTPSTLPEGPTKTVTTPGTTVTVPGPTTTVPAVVKLAAGVAVPKSLSNAVARKGISVSLLATKASSAKVTLKNGRKTLSTKTVKLSANGPKSAKLSATKLARRKAARLTVSVTVTAGSEKTTRTAKVSVTR